MSEVSNYIQPDHFDTNKKSMNEFLGQNPLLMLARTCQNIGVETKTVSANSMVSFKPVSDVTTSTKTANTSSSPGQLTKVPSNRRSPLMISSIGNFSTANNTVSQSTMGASQTKASTVVHSVDESDFYIPPSSNSLIQLARLSSSLQLPSATSNDRHKRASPIDTHTYLTGVTGKSSHYNSTSRPPKRARRQSVGRSTSSSSSFASKPIDFSSHFSSHSSPLSTSSSVSPSSLRSTPPSHTSPSPTQHQNQSSNVLKGIPNFRSTSESSQRVLDAFYNLGSLLGASPERLRDLFITVAESLANHNTQHSNLLLKQQQSKAHTPATDPSTQCLYCGHVSLDMGSLVQHIYTHLASLHKQQTETPPISRTLHQPSPAPIALTPTLPHPNQSLIDLFSSYARFVQKNSENPSPTSSLSSSEPNSLFQAWLSIFSPSYGEGLSGANR